MTGIKEEECVSVGECAKGKEGGAEGGCLSVLVDRAGDCSQIQLIPSGCIHLSSASDEKERQKGKERDP